jgi:23S rRNA pseudouridine1911/1915/1917 synthase
MSNLEVSRAQRLDQRVIELLPLLSRGFAVKLIEQGKVTVDGEPVLKAGYKLRIVINKPLGVLTHSKGDFNPEATVASFLRERVADLDGSRAGIVHRLDRATSGVMICAKTSEALSFLQKQFSLRKVKKKYIAIVSGHLANEHAVIDMPIERNPKKPQTFRVGANGKSALTEYHVLETNDKLSLLELAPQTGRTHQLRVHLNHLGHPILGDTFYGGKPAERLFLHALSLEITLPNRERKTFSAILPESFAEAMKQNG